MAKKQKSERSSSGGGLLALGLIGLFFFAGSSEEKTEEQKLKEQADLQNAAAKQQAENERKAAEAAQIALEEERGRKNPGVVITDAPSIPKGKTPTSMFKSKPKAIRPATDVATAEANYNTLFAWFAAPGVITSMDKDEIKAVALELADLQRERDNMAKDALKSLGIPIK